MKTMKIMAIKTTDTPRWGMSVTGYTLLSGAPTSKLVRLQGEKRWRRLMCWQFSNAGTLFLRIRGANVVVAESDLPDEVPEPVYVPFRDLDVGTLFEFDHRTCEGLGGLTAGPWRKTGRRTYSDGSFFRDHRVGTVNVLTYRL